MAKNSALKKAVQAGRAQARATTKDKARKKRGEAVQSDSITHVIGTDNVWTT